MSRYLLGPIGEDDHSRLEDAYFADDETFEDLEAVETELVDAYARGRLGEEDRPRFERLLLGSPRLRERVAFARRFVAKSDDLAVPAHRPRAVGRRAPSAWLAWRPALVPGLAAAGLILAAGAAWWAVRPSSPPASTEAKRVQRLAPPPGLAIPPERPPADAQRTPNAGADGIVAFTLVPGLTRALDQGATLTIPAGAREVHIRLDYEGEAHPTYRAVIRTPEGREVWSRYGLTPMRAGARSVSVAFPAAALPAGDLVLTLSADVPGGPIEGVADYAFRIVKQ